MNSKKRYVKTTIVILMTVTIGIGIFEGSGFLPPPPGPTAFKMNVSGVVTHHVTGNPVSSVYVRLEDRYHNRIDFDYTDGNGYYEVEGTQISDVFFVLFQKTDFETKTVRIDHDGSIPIDNQTYNCDFKEIYDYDISGTIYDQRTWRPLGGVTVSLHDILGNEMDSAITDKNGQFTHLQGTDDYNIGEIRCTNKNKWESENLFVDSTTVDVDISLNRIVNHYALFVSMGSDTDGRIDTLYKTFVYGGGTPKIYGGYGFHPDDIYLLTTYDYSYRDYETTLANINRAFYELAARVGPNDEVVIYFGSHGTRDFSMIGPDGNYDGVNLKFHLSLINEDAIKYIFLGQCYSGGWIPYISYSDPHTKYQNRVIFTSSDENKTGGSTWHQAIGNILVIDKINDFVDKSDWWLTNYGTDDGYVTLNEIQGYIEYKESEFGSNPMFWCSDNINPSSTYIYDGYMYNYDGLPT